jgi:hypothetical protein
MGAVNMSEIKVLLQISSMLAYLSGLSFLSDLRFNLPAINLGTEVNDGRLLFNGKVVDGLNWVGLMIDIVLLN